MSLRNETSAAEAAATAFPGWDVVIALDCNSQRLLHHGFRSGMRVSLFLGHFMYFFGCHYGQGNFSATLLHQVFDSVATASRTNAKVGFNVGQLTL